MDVFDFNKKIIYHPENIVAYKEGKRPFPVTLEVDLTNRCNHRCSFCFYAEHISQNKDSLDTAVLKRALLEAKALGTKAISFTGGGEPMLHKDYAEIIKYTKEIGFDVGTITNGSVIQEKNVDVLLDSLQWIRFSVAGGDRESYHRVQGVDQFERIIANLQLLTQRKRERGNKLHIGVRTLVTPENLFSLQNLAHILRCCPVDYFQLAPDQFSQDQGAFWQSAETQAIFWKVQEILAPSSIKLLTTTYMASQAKLDFPRTCYAHFFMLAITAEGFVTFCKNARGAEDFTIGNIYEKPLKEIWEDKKTKDIERWVRPNNCGLFCKHMAINNAMEEMLHPDTQMTPNFVG